MPLLRLASATARAALRARALRTSAPAAPTVTTEPVQPPSQGPLRNTASEQGTPPPPPRRAEQEVTADGAPTAHGTAYEAGGTPPRAQYKKCARTHARAFCPPARGASHRHMCATRRARRARRARPPPRHSGSCALLLTTRARARG
jgi:hypothetical protein